MLLSCTQGGGTTSYCPIHRVEVPHLTVLHTGWRCQILLLCTQGGGSISYCTVHSVDLPYITVLYTGWRFHTILFEHKFVSNDVSPFYWIADVPVLQFR